MRLNIQQPLTEDQLQQLTPQTPASLRALMLQRLTPQFIPQPTLTPQQQQVQNMKTNNDIKEQIINQARQDLINEQSRKSENLRREQEVKKSKVDAERKYKEDKAEFENQLKMESQFNELNEKIKDLEFKKLQHANDSKISQKKIELANQLAKVDQLKSENEKLRYDNIHNTLKNDVEAAVYKADRLKRENDALQKQLEANKQEEFKQQLDTAFTNIAKENIRAQVLEEMNHERNSTVSKNKFRMQLDSLMTINQKLLISNDVDIQLKKKNQRIELKRNNHSNYNKCIKIWFLILIERN